MPHFNCLSLNFDFVNFDSMLLKLESDFFFECCKIPSTELRPLIGEFSLSLSLAAAHSNSQGFAHTCEVFGHLCSIYCQSRESSPRYFPAIHAESLEFLDCH